MQALSGAWSKGLTAAGRAVCGSVHRVSRLRPEQDFRLNIQGQGFPGGGRRIQTGLPRSDLHGTPAGALPVGLGDGPARRVGTADGCRGFSDPSGALRSLRRGSLRSALPRRLSRPASSWTAPGKKKKGGGGGGGPPRGGGCPFFPIWGVFFFCVHQREGDWRAPAGRGPTRAFGQCVHNSARPWFDGDEPTYSGPQGREAHGRDPRRAGANSSGLRAGATYRTARLATPRGFATGPGRALWLRSGGLGQRRPAFGPFRLAMRHPLPGFWLCGDGIQPGRGTAGVEPSRRDGLCPGNCWPGGGLNLALALIRSGGPERPAPDRPFKALRKGGGGRQTAGNRAAQCWPQGSAQRC